MRPTIIAEVYGSQWFARAHAELAEGTVPLEITLVAMDALQEGARKALRCINVWIILGEWVEAGRSAYRHRVNCRWRNEGFRSPQATRSQHYCGDARLVDEGVYVKPPDFWASKTERFALKRKKATAESTLVWLRAELQRFVK